MAQITATDVNKLRKMTGAGMMDCKMALQEADGNYDKAIEIIRKKGQMVASKRADREATQGAVLAMVSSNKSSGAIIALNCETDFVAKNQGFISFAQSILDLAIQNDSADLESLKNASLEGKPVSEKIVEQIGIIGEKIELAYYEIIKAAHVAAYIHPGNKLAALVGFSKILPDQVAKDIAMQVAAMSPVAVDKEDVSPQVLEQEKEIGRDQARREGKPENMIEKIAEGKLNKFYKESTLMNQEFTKDSRKTVRQYLQETDKEVKVTAFRRFTLSN